LPSSRFITLLRIASFFLLAVVALPAARAQASPEEAIWDLEHSYWRYVEANDLSAYRNLWDENFLGWPGVSPEPVRKDHITDWITSQTQKSLAFKTIEFKPASIQVTGDLAVVCYWLTYKWQDKDGTATARTNRVFHTWIKTGRDWRIISGMSMPQTVTLAQ
jgi:ketosteroid isomerase-like protein